MKNFTNFSNYKNVDDTTRLFTSDQVSEGNQISYHSITNAPTTATNSSNSQTKTATNYPQPVPLPIPINHLQRRQLQQVSPIQPYSQLNQLESYQTTYTGINTIPQTQTTSSAHQNDMAFSSKLPATTLDNSIISAENNHKADAENSLKENRIALLVSQWPERQLKVIYPMILSSVVAYSTSMSNDSFLLSLIRLLGVFGVSLKKIPELRGHPLDLLSLYRSVTTLGGFKRVTMERKWPTVANELNFFNIPDIEYFLLVLKCLYGKILYLYEQIFFQKISPFNIVEIIIPQLVIVSEKKGSESSPQSQSNQQAYPQTQTLSSNTTNSTLSPYLNHQISPFSSQQNSSSAATGYKQFSNIHQSTSIIPQHPPSKQIPIINKSTQIKKSYSNSKQRSFQQQQQQQLPSPLIATTNRIDSIPQKEGIFTRPEQTISISTPISAALSPHQILFKESDFIKQEFLHLTLHNPHTISYSSKRLFDYGKITSKRLRLSLMSSSNVEFTYSCDAIGALSVNGHGFSLKALPWLLNVYSKFLVDYLAMLNPLQTYPFLIPTEDYIFKKSTRSRDIWLLSFLNLSLDYSIVEGNFVGDVIDRINGILIPIRNSCCYSSYLNSTFCRGYLNEKKRPNNESTINDENQCIASNRPFLHALSLLLSKERWGGSGIIDYTVYINCIDILASISPFLTEIQDCDMFDECIDEILSTLSSQSLPFQSSLFFCEQEYSAAKYDWLRGMLVRDFKILTTIISYYHSNVKYIIILGNFFHSFLQQEKSRDSTKRIRCFKIIKSLAGNFLLPICLGPLYKFFYSLERLVKCMQTDVSFLAPLWLETILFGNNNCSRADQIYKNNPNSGDFHFGDFSLIEGSLELLIEYFSQSFYFDVPASLREITIDTNIDWKVMFDIFCKLLVLVLKIFSTSTQSIPTTSRNGLIPLEHEIKHEIRNQLDSSKSQPAPVSYDKNQLFLLLLHSTPMRIAKLLALTLHVACEREIREAVDTVKKYEDDFILLQSCISFRLSAEIEDIFISIMNAINKATDNGEDVFP